MTRSRKGWAARVRIGDPSASWK
ncbi:hypothetical protein C5167_038081 [Papaver somniferum]|uniref:Uncharacterized protein n=1 Tax=Papaver somniferum TaxID=3469 RepID=A0A4Y7ICL4_PAPSO|nr:hypothetical protein C5167_038081 [Papaver somniferum]